VACDPVLREASALIATPQIREAATVGGNLCQTKRCWFFRNGFDCYKRGGVTRPCYAVMGDHRFYHSIQDAHRCQAITPSDLATTLVALDAEIEVRRSGGARRIVAESFYTGPGETGLTAGEIVCAIEIPAHAQRRRSAYRKLALWRGAFAIATACVSAELSGGRVADLKVALGGVGPVPVRVHGLERMLRGERPEPAAIEAGIAAWTKSTHPLRDNHWKAFAAADLLRRTLSDVLAQADQPS
jgi:CO/xanthine dehydrogenase FAD-binding subunit